MLTPEGKVWEVLKKVKKNWSHELKRASIQLPKCKAPNREANPQHLAWQTWKVSIRLPDQYWLSDKVTALFELRHARRYGRISFEIGRSVGSSVATSKKQQLSFQFIVLWTLKPCSLKAVAIRQPWDLHF